MLVQEKISYRWGFPFKFVFEYGNRKIIIRNVKEAEAFLSKSRLGSKGFG